MKPYVQQGHGVIRSVTTMYHVPGGVRRNRRTIFEVTSTGGLHKRSAPRWWIKRFSTTNFPTSPVRSAKQDTDAHAEWAIIKSTEWCRCRFLRCTSFCGCFIKGNGCIYSLRGRWKTKHRQRLRNTMCLCCVRGTQQGNGREQSTTPSTNHRY